MQQDDNQTSAEEIPLQVLPTPNPEALMFRAARPLVHSGTYQYRDAADTGDSPLAQALFQLDGVVSVLIAHSFVTVTRRRELSWDPLATQVQQVLRTFLARGEDAVDIAQRGVSTDYSPIEQKILDIIEEQVRPALVRDGGDIEYMGFEDGIVMLRLVGACHSCPHATLTLTYGVQQYLMENIEEVRGVQRVM